MIEILNKLIELHKNGWDVAINLRHNFTAEPYYEVILIKHREETRYVVTSKISLQDALQKVYKLVED